MDGTDSAGGEPATVVAASMGEFSWIGTGSEYAFREGPEADFDRPLVALTFFAGTSDYKSALLLCTGFDELTISSSPGFLFAPTPLMSGLTEL